MDSLIQRLMDARQRGVAWVKAHVEANGRVAGWERRTTYARVPWMACVAGETALAHRVLDWIDSHALAADGDLRASVAQSPFASHRVTYHRTVIAYGAHLAGRYDLSHRIMRWVQTFQDPVTGGYWGSRGDPATVEQTSDAAGQALITQLLVGNIEAARRAGEFLVRLWELQPDRERVFYNHYSHAQGLITEFESPKHRYQGAIYADRPGQFFLVAPIAAMALARLYLALPDERYLTTARAYQHFARHNTRDQHPDAMVYLGGCGAAWLYIATGTAEYRADILDVAEQFLTHQQPDGHWYVPPHIDPDQSIVNATLVTVEWVIHLDWLIAALAARS